MEKRMEILRKLVRAYEACDDARSRGDRDALNRGIALVESLTREAEGLGAL